MRRCLLAACLIIVCIAASAQQRIDYTRVFHLALVPGISTNGMHPGGYHNYFSLNLTSGYSASNYLLEVGVISNLNVNETRGLQIAGLANLTGANAFAGLQKREKDEKVRTGFEANLSGIQIAGLGNVVLNNVFGGQVAGAVNLSKGALQGVQVGGLGNLVYKYTFGVQLASLWNMSYQSMDGIQISSAMNYTKGSLIGTQVSIYNRAGSIEGKNSYENDDPTGLQIGLVNWSGRMNGFQVGLINFSSSMQGTQIGLVNIYRRGTQQETRDGTAIGLLNFGESGYASVYANEMFYLNIELATGNSKNLRIKAERKNIYIQNALIYAVDPPFVDGKRKWAVGYGLKKFYFNRSTMPGMNNFRYYAFGVDALHINHEPKKFTDELSLLARLNATAGTRIHVKLPYVYVFAGLTYNFYLSDRDADVSPEFLESNAFVGERFLTMWPGFLAGIQIQP
ncbi:MAG: hypothetical protein LOY03_14660 [Cyclobacteriaceae bacterium]|nr:hypothetical protein [Cyclobacteriaceae bacterium]